MTRLGEYTLDDDPSRVDWSRVHAWLASSYWSPGIARDRVELAARNSAFVLGAYKGSEQVGYLRVISDRVRFAYLCDVWVDAGHRGRGLGRAMVAEAMSRPEFSTVAWTLATLDAHGVYAPLGFAPLSEPQRWMSAKPRDPEGNLSGRA